MKKKQILLSFLCGMVVPLAMLALATLWQEEQLPEQQETQASETTAPIQMETSSAMMLDVLTGDGQVVQMELDEYLTGVVLSEMPASFHSEALKAQAVVARTYALKRVYNGGKHEQAALCMEASCCQGYMSPEEYIAQGGSEESVSKVSAAVAATTMEVLTYDGELIDATYFSCSGGSTEAAVEVWGSDVPYLQATDSPGEEDAAYYSDTISMSAGDFAAAVGFTAQGDAQDWFGQVTYTEGGGVDTMEICGTVYEGTELRKLLGLRSTAFTVVAQGDMLIIQTRGFGHRVGMSQYGAQAMAEQGSSYTEILTHYYRGTQVQTVEEA